MNFKETVEYLYTRLPMYSRIGDSAFKKDLTNTIALCELLGNPHNKFKSIHVGGTNGKGSVSHTLASVFQHAGYKTGLYTSPHLYDFRERIKINGSLVSESFVVDFVEKNKGEIEKIEPSFFEITVAMAFKYFADQQVDIAIVEVGLGGRLDSTNIITPELSVITNIGWDHMNMLGDTLEKISYEKAGIIKEEIPVVVGEYKEDTGRVFLETAKKKSSPLYFSKDHFREKSFSWNGDKLLIEVEDVHLKNTLNYTIDLPGIYQVKNICTTLTALKALKSKYHFPDPTIKSALENVKKTTNLFGRWEVIHKNPTIVLEVAHNREGVDQMLQHLQYISFHQLHLVIGFVKDKDIDAIIESLPTNAVYYFTNANIPRALPASELQEIGIKYNLIGDNFTNVNEALQQTLTNASKDDLIVVCGSIFLVAEVDKESITHFS